jgi:Fis family transcriptional regulator, factor for inversion stimulation protein
VKLHFAAELRAASVIIRIRRLSKSIKFSGMTVPRENEAIMIIENDAPLADAVRKYIILTLASCGGNRTHAAKILGISLRCLRDKLRGYANAGIQVTPAHQPKSETRPVRSALS